MTASLPRGRRDRQGFLPPQPGETYALLRPRHCDCGCGLDITEVRVEYYDFAAMWWAVTVLLPGHDGQDGAPVKRMRLTAESIADHLDLPARREDDEHSIFGAFMAIALSRHEAEKRKQRAAERRRAVLTAMWGDDEW